MAFDEITLGELRSRLSEYVMLEFGIDVTRGNIKCLNPEHNDKTPSMCFYPSGKNGASLHCFGACDKSFDVFDVARWAIGSNNFKEQVRHVAAVLRIPLDDSSPLPAFRPKRATVATIETPKPIEGQNVADAVLAASWAILADSPTNGARVALDVLHSRGFTDSDIQKYRFGWVAHPSAMFPSGFKGAEHHPSGYICIPMPDDAEFSSVRRCVFRPAGWASKAKEWKQRGAAYPLYHEYLLRSGLPRVAVAEGVFDAVSIEILTEVPTIALMGSGGSNRLESVIAHTPKDKRPARLLIATDNDNAGRKSKERIAHSMAALGQPCNLGAEFPCRVKDPNEWLIALKGVLT